MSDHDAAVSFVLDYDLSVDDLRESTAIGRSAARRAKSLVRRWELPVIACALAAITVFVNHQVTACFLPGPAPAPAPAFQLLVWQCAPTSPSDLVWNNTWLFVADGVVLAGLLSELYNSWPRLPRWYLRRWMRKQGFEGRYHYEIAATGLTVTAPDGTASFVPWPLFSPVRETRERFFLSTRQSRGGTVLILPKRALSDQSSERRLGEFLRASAGREASPA